MTINEQHQQRFGGIARLYGESGLAALGSAHFVVAGLGGVGTWVAEALARSAVAQLTLIDMDDVCITNTNRQTHTLSNTVGQPKVSVMSERLKLINPNIIVNEVHDFLEPANITTLITPQHHVVIDCTDAVIMKTALAAYCCARKIRLIMLGSSGGKSDPSRVQCSDLGKTTSDPMLAKVRRQLYSHYNFARDSNRKFGVDAVFSCEQMVYPKPDGSVSQQKSAMTDGVKLDCAGGFGSATMVTGTFGFIAAARAVERYLAQSR